MRIPSRIASLDIIRSFHLKRGELFKIACIHGNNVRLADLSRAWEVRHIRYKEWVQGGCEGKGREGSHSCTCLRGQLS
eukprot:1142730-Pelagomonas_calceolata.AAC.1